MCNWIEKCVLRAYDHWPGWVWVMHVAFQGCCYLHLFMALLDGWLRNEVICSSPGMRDQGCRCGWAPLGRTRNARLVGFVFGGEWWWWEAGETERNRKKKRMESITYLDIGKQTGRHEKLQPLTGEWVSRKERALANKQVEGMTSSHIEGD